MLTRLPRWCACAHAAVAARAQVAEGAGGRTMGYIMGKAEGVGESWHGHVSAVTVAPEFRRMGLARTLMCNLEEVWVLHAHTHARARARTRTDARVYARTGALRSVARAARRAGQAPADACPSQPVRTRGGATIFARALTPPRPRTPAHTRACR